LPRTWVPFPPHTEKGREEGREEGREGGREEASKPILFLERMGIKFFILSLYWSPSSLHFNALWAGVRKFFL
jgi:hypothetical protein